MSEEKGEKMIFEANYKDYTELLELQVAEIKPDTGARVQDIYLHDTDEDSLTPRERFLMLLVAIKYEIEHDILTEELEGELWWYQKDYTEGRLDGILGDDEKDEAIKDLLECYHKVYG